MALADEAARTLIAAAAADAAAAHAATGDTAAGDAATGDAAAGDVWEAAKRGFAAVMGRGDSRRTELAERRLDETWQQLRVAPGAERQDALIVTWRTRLADLLEEDQDIADDLRTLLGGIRATGYGVAAGRDLNVTALGGGVAAGIIHGNVAPANPTVPGLAMS
jgi:hypothetical protein